MRAQKTTATPNSLLFFDTETKATVDKEDREVSYHKLFFGYAYATRLEKGVKSREKWCRFTTIEEFWKFVESRLDNHRPLYVFAHNLPFDLTITDFWHHTERVGMTTDYMVLEDPPTFLRMSWNGKPIMFIDTMNYWPEALAAIGESIGLSKLAMPGYDASKEEWDIYAKRDVEIVAKAVIDLIRLLIAEDLGNFAISAASLAMSAFKKRFMKVPIFIHDNDRAIKLERESYHGGLVHNFYVGKTSGELIHMYDVNSLYPFVMKRPVPTKILHYYPEIDVKELRIQMMQFAAVARVKINSETYTFPKYHDNKLIEATGRYNTVLCGQELKKAITTGSIEKVYHAAIYEQHIIFDHYVDFFYKMRQDNPKNINPVKNRFAKLLMNSLYGKFATNSFDWRDLEPGVIRQIYADEGKVMPDCYSGTANIPGIAWSQSKWFPLGLEKSYQVRNIGGKTQIKYVIGEHHESFPLISSYITSYARDYLRSLIGFAGRDNCYYCDTDSLFVNSTGRQLLDKAGMIDDKELGKLKYEGTEKHCHFYGPKDYVFGHVEKIKGVSAKAIKIGEGEYLQNQFEGVRSVLKRKAEPFITVQWVRKLNKRQYNKGTVLPSGRVDYFRLLEEDWLEEQQQIMG